MVTAGETIDEDEQLLTSGSAAAFAAFYARNVDLVAAFFARRLGRGELVLDLTAETFARALERREQFDPSRGPAAAWLFSIARHLLIDTVRQRRVAADARRRLAMQPQSLDDADLRRVEERTSRPLQDALGRLPEHQREVVRRRILDEESYAEIAVEIQVSEQVVRQRVSRGLARLRRTVKEPS